MTRPTLSLVLGLALITWINVSTFGDVLYLREGYDLRFSMSGATPAIAPSVQHISFPPWRMIVELMIGLGAVLAVIAVLCGRRGGTTLGWSVLAASILVSSYDVLIYGTLGAPDATWRLAAVLGIALYCQLARRRDPAA